MYRLLAILLTFLLAVTPTVDVMCRALCTPDATAVPCHHLAAPAADGSLSSASCKDDAAAAVAPVERTRTAVSPAPLLRVKLFDVAQGPVFPGGFVRRPPAYPRHAQGFLSTVVLRI